MRLEYALHFVPEYTGYYHFTLMIPTGATHGYFVQPFDQNAYFSSFEKNSKYLKTFNKLQNRAHGS